MSLLGHRVMALWK